MIAPLAISVVIWLLSFAVEPANETRRWGVLLLSLSAYVFGGLLATN